MRKWLGVSNWTSKKTEFNGGFTLHHCIAIKPILFVVFGDPKWVRWEIKQVFWRIWHKIFMWKALVVKNIDGFWSHTYLYPSIDIHIVTEEEFSKWDGQNWSLKNGTGNPYDNDSMIHVHSIMTTYYFLNPIIRPILQRWSLKSAKNLQIKISWKSSFILIVIFLTFDRCNTLSSHPNFHFVFIYLINRESSLKKFIAINERGVR